MSERAVQPSELDIRLSPRGQLRPLGLLAVFLVACLLLWGIGLVPGWLTLAGVLVFGTVITFGLATALRSRRWGVVVRLDPAGVAVPGHDPVPWSDLAEVVVTGLQPGWFFVLGGRRYPVVALIPRPGVQLPALRVPGGSGPTDRLGAARERLYGTRLLMVPHAMTATVEQITTAARDWGHLPVHTRLPRRTR